MIFKTNILNGIFLWEKDKELHYSSEFWGNFQAMQKQEEHTARVYKTQDWQWRLCPSVAVINVYQGVDQYLYESKIIETMDY